MADLRQCCESLGLNDCRTHLNSGNAVGSIAASKAREFAAALTRKLEHTFGFPVPVVTRTAVEVQRIIAHNPFLAGGVAKDSLHIAFLSARPSAAAVRALKAPPSQDDRFLLQGGEVFLHLPNGVARTKLTNAWMDKSLGVTSTQRNWATVLALANLLNATGSD
jgi:uncharacterized protein (DUF1697 family)